MSPRIDINQINPQHLLPPQTQQGAGINSEQSRAEQNVEEFENELTYNALSLKEQANRINRDDDVYRFRKRGYGKLFDLIEGWLLLVSLFLLGAATGVLQISDKVLIALLSTATATVLGIFAIAAKWLFPKE